MAEAFFSTLGAGLASAATVVGNGIAACSCGVVTAVAAVSAPYWIGAAAGAGACAPPASARPWPLRFPPLGGGFGMVATHAATHAAAA